MVSFVEHNYSVRQDDSGLSINVAGDGRATVRFTYAYGEGGVATYDVEYESVRIAIDAATQNGQFRESVMDAVRRPGGPLSSLGGETISIIDNTLLQLSYNMHSQIPDHLLSHNSVVGNSLQRQNCQER